MEEKKNAPFALLTVGGRDYMLRLTAGAAMRLEERLGSSVYCGLKRLDEVTVMIDFLYALTEGFMPDFSRNAAALLFDDFINEGGTLRKMNGIILEAMDRSGFFDCGEAAKPPQSL